MLGTKCPSMTSRWIQSAPAASTARTSSPSLEKSEARIDGAMTRGRDANWADMCVFPKNAFGRAEGFRVTRAGPAGNAGKSAGEGAENSAAAASIAGGKGPCLLRKTPVLLVFRAVRAFAH